MKRTIRRARALAAASLSQKTCSAAAAALLVASAAWPVAADAQSRSAAPKASAVLPAPVQQAFSAHCRKISNPGWAVAFHPERFSLLAYRGSKDASKDEAEAGILLIQRADVYLLTGDFNGDGVTDYVLYGEDGCMEPRQARFDDRDGPMPYGTDGGPPSFAALSRTGGYDVREIAAAFLTVEPVVRRGTHDLLMMATRGNGSEGRCGRIARVAWGWNGRDFADLENYDPQGRRVDDEGCPLRVGTPSTARPGGSPAPPAPAAKPNWGIQRTDQRISFAFVAQGTPAVPQMTIGCLRGAPAMMAQLAVRKGRNVLLEVATPEGRAAVTLARDGSSGMWIGTFDGDRIPRLLAGNAAGADLALDGAAAGNISLAGSTLAVTQALSPCWTPAPAPVAASPVAAPIGPLEIAPGYYVDAAIPCGQAYDLFFYDGARVGITDYDAKGDVRGLRIRPIGKVARSKDGSFYMASIAAELRRLPGGQIELTIQDTGPPLRLCRREEIPVKFRAN